MEASSDAAEPAFAAVDWGTTRFRALAARRRRRGRRRAAQRRGPARRPRERFAAVLERHLAAMGAAASLPVIICGMAGARQGWIEAPYVATPARFDEIFAGAVARPGQRARRPHRARARPARPRARPTSCAARKPSSPASPALHGPASGLHARHAFEMGRAIADGAVAGFQTWLTGELFSVLSTHSILRHALGDDPAKVSPDNPVFLQWLRRRAVAPRRCRPALVPHPRLDIAARHEAGRCGGSAVRPADRQRNRLGPQAIRERRLRCRAGRFGRARRSLRRSTRRCAGFTPTPADAETAVRTGLLEAARRNFGLDAGRRAKA